MASNAPSSSILPLLRQVAPRLARRFFNARKCPNQLSGIATTRSITSRSHPFESKHQTPFLKAFRSQSRAASLGVKPSPLANLGKGFKRNVAKPELKQDVKRSFPMVSDRNVGRWLIGSAISVYGIVVLGGLTRLTESGLSITEWRPVTGTLPPMNEHDWNVEFEKYKASPEFQKLNPNMNLSEFKKIFWMEWSHRQVGRAIGLGVLLPTIYFIARRKVSAHTARSLILINGLIGLQGFVGWWMVKSGLKDDLFANNAHPRVSQYRLTTHLALAFTVYSTMLWNGLKVFMENRLLVSPNPRAAEHRFKLVSNPALGIFRKSAFGVTALVFVTAMSGALVAGLDAGLIYNDFPYMGLGLTPPFSELWSSFYSRLPDQSDLWWRNMLENPSLVQLDHRILATSTFVAIHALFAYARFKPAIKNVVPKGVKMAMSAALGLVWIQVTLGISTLLYLVPIPLAVAHQAGSLALLTSMIVAGSRLWIPKRMMTLSHFVGQASKPATTAAPRKSTKLIRAAKEAPKKVVHKPHVQPST